VDVSKKPQTAPHRAAFEKEAASLLGFVIFEWSRLEMELGLALVWQGEGCTLEKQTSDVGKEAFSERLLRLKSYVKSKYPDTAAMQAYDAWTDRADKLRLVRNALVHGRWGISPSTGTVANIAGLPTSGGQIETRYTLAGLEEIVGAMKTLRGSLGQLVRDWPL
jgi:hypothetical protein